jgi:hypothetical protein
MLTGRELIWTLGVPPGASKSVIRFFPKNGDGCIFCVGRGNSATHVLVSEWAFHQAKGEN